MVNWCVVHCAVLEAVCIKLVVVWVVLYMASASLSATSVSFISGRCAMTFVQRKRPVNNKQKKTT